MVAPWCHQRPQFLLNFESNVLSEIFSLMVASLFQDGCLTLTGWSSHTPNRKRKEGNRKGGADMREVRLLQKPSAYVSFGQLKTGLKIFCS